MLMSNYICISFVATFIHTQPCYVNSRAVSLLLICTILSSSKPAGVWPQLKYYARSWHLNLPPRLLEGLPHTEEGDSRRKTRSLFSPLHTQALRLTTNCVSWLLCRPPLSLSKIKWHISSTLSICCLDISRCMYFNYKSAKGINTHLSRLQID